MADTIRLTPREERVWDSAYAVAFVHCGDAMEAIIIADSSILNLRNFEKAHPERSLPATVVFV
jgi:hypothetical protein